MKLSYASLGAFALTISSFASAQIPDPNVIVPPSSMEFPGEIGRRAHTNHLIFVGQWRPDPIDPLAAMFASSKPALFAGGYAPADIQAAYGVNPGGSGEKIAIVGAYDYPTAQADFAFFSSTYGLPNNSSLQVVYASGSKPAYDSGWSQEAALDVEWSHAMAPQATIYLVEANSNSFADLMQAVDKAKTLGATAISMSWGSSEFSGESSYDSHFSSGVFFASSGDSGGQVNWPAASTNVIGVGGTHLVMSGSTVTSESAWSGSGGGPSAVYSRPSYQSAIQSIVGTKRGTPDISAVADPNTGVRVYWNGAWYIFGGTSVSSPCMAGMYTSSSASATSSASELTGIYSRLGSSVYRDITSGRAGRFKAASGWDFITGVGAPTGPGAF